jgi:hypothetical protein
MQAGEEIDPGLQIEAKSIWVEACYNAIESAAKLSAIGVHKQVVNRLLEPFQWMTTILTGTEWANLFHLRCHKDAQPEFQTIARMICDAYYTSTPRQVGLCEWHLPLIWEEDRARMDRLGFFGTDPCWVSVGRCARVSYLTHDGRRDIDEDRSLALRLKTSGHWSPFEHVAQPLPGGHGEAPCGNLRGWKPFRKLFAEECRHDLLPSPADYWQTAD